MVAAVVDRVEDAVFVVVGVWAAGVFEAVEVFGIVRAEVVRVEEGVLIVVGLGAALLVFEAIAVFGVVGAGVGRIEDLVAVAIAAAPTGEIAQWLGAKQINSRGEPYLEKYYQHLGGNRMTTQDRLYATILEQRAGRGPCFLDTSEADPRKLEGTITAYLSMAPPAAMIMADEAYYARSGGRMAPVEITGGEPLVVGGHGLSGYWIDERRRTTLPGLWAAGDVAGGVPKKYASGAWAEAAIAIRDMIDVARSERRAELDEEDVARERDRAYTPLESGEGIPSTDLEERLQKILDEYAGGISVQYGYSEGELKLAQLHLARIEDELTALRANDSHDLMLAHEVMDRVIVARVLVEHMLHRKETRWHVYQQRLDYPERDDTRWMVFVNSVREKSGAIRMFERPVTRVPIDVALPPPVTAP